MPVPKSPDSPVLMNVIFPRGMGSPLYLTVPETSPVGTARPPREHPERIASPSTQVRISQLRHHLATEPYVKGIVPSQAPSQGISVPRAGVSRGSRDGPLR